MYEQKKKKKKNATVELLRTLIFQNRFRQLIAFAAHLPFVRKFYLFENYILNVSIQFYLLLVKKTEIFLAKVNTFGINTEDIP